jgi:hypothetical protein
MGTLLFEALDDEPEHVAFLVQDVQPVSELEDRAGAPFLAVRPLKY